MQSSNLNESWMLFSVSVREYCHAENQGQRDRAATDLKWHLGRIKSIVAGITPESLPKLAPVYLENLQQFVESWDAPELFRRGQHDGKDQMHLGLLELEEPVIRMAIRQVEEAAEAPPIAPYLEKDDVLILEDLARRKGIVAYQADIDVVNRDRASDRLNYLLSIGYVQHPPDRTKGWLITAEGMSRLEVLPAID